MIRYCLLPEFSISASGVNGRIDHFLGASAGELEAFEGFFQNISTDSGMAFVLIPYLDPTHVSLMRIIFSLYP